jgi:hypothetical protein
MPQTAMSTAPFRRFNLLGLGVSHLHTSPNGGTLACNPFTEALMMVLNAAFKDIFSKCTRQQSLKKH